MMAKSICSITSSLLLVLLLLAGESFAQTTTIRDGNSKGVADVMGSAPAGTEQGLVTRPIMPTGATTAAVAIRCVNAAGNAFESCGGGGGGGGDATAANQTTMIGHIDGIEALIGTTNTTLSTIDGRVDGLESVLGATGDAAATAGSTGSVSAKLRLATSQLDAIQTSVQTLDNAISGSAFTVVQPTGSNLHIVCDSGCAGSGGSSMVDDAAFTPGTTSINPTGFLFDDVSPDSVNEGDGGIGRMSANRNQYMQIRDNAGNERGLNVDANGEIGIGAIRSALPAGTNGIGKLTANSGVDIGDVDVTSIPGTGVEDAAETAGGTLHMMGTVRRDTAASSATTTGDNATLNTDSTGRAWTRPTGSVTPANSFSIPTDAITVWAINGCYNGTTIDLCTKGSGGNGTTDANTQRVTLSSDSTGTVIATSATAANFLNRPDTSGATGAAPPARANFAAGIGSGATGGFLTGFAVADGFVPVNVSTATTTLLITGVASRHVYITAFDFLTAAANNVALISGTGATCGTSTAGLNGGTTAGSGWNFLAGGGIAKGNGLGAINRTTDAGDSVCVVTSAATQLSGTVSYAIY